MPATRHRTEEGTKTMEMGMIGLGRMGANMVRFMMKGEHTCVGYARRAEVVQGLVAEGMVGSTSLEDLVSKLTRPRAVWLMVPAAAVDGMTGAGR